MITMINLALITLFTLLYWLMTREMYIYITHGTSEKSDYTKPARIIIMLVLIMSWIYDIKQDYHASAAGFLLIGALMISLLNTTVIVIGQLLKTLEKKVAPIVPFSVIAFTAILAISIAAIVLFDGIEKATPTLFQLFIISGCLFLIVAVISGSILGMRKSTRK